MKKTDITVEMVYVTPEVAKNFLRYNTKNRKVDKASIRFLTAQMNENLWEENGESIVFDCNNELKDGQHRLESIVATGKSYFFPIVRGVAPKSMSTIDTGKNRSSGDVLHLNGFKNANLIASFIRAIDKYSDKKSKGATHYSNTRINSLTNQQVLEYCEKHYDVLHESAKKVFSVYQKQSTPKVLTATQIFIILHLISKSSEFNPYHIDFISYITGANKQASTGATYVYEKLLSSKVKKEPLNFYWLLGVTLKAWNYFSDGNPAIVYIKFNIESELPKPNMFFNK